MFCLFSRAYSFQWKALYKNVTSHNKRPIRQGHMPKFEPQIHENTMPMMTNMRPDTSISLRYFFMLLFVFSVHTDGNGSVVEQFNFHISPKFASTYRLAYSF